MGVYFTCMCVPAVHVCAWCLRSPDGGRRGWDLLEVELQTVVIYRGGAEILCPLEQQSVPLGGEPSLQAQLVFKTGSPVALPM